MGGDDRVGLAFMGELLSWLVASDAELDRSSHLSAAGFPDSANSARRLGRDMVDLAVCLAGSSVRSSTWLWRSGRAGLGLPMAARARGHWTGRREAAGRRRCVAVLAGAA